MEKEQRITEKTLEYWENENNCARSCACGILSYYGKKPLCDPFFKAMLPMGGGVGERSICGAIIGSLSAISLILAEQGLSDEAIRIRTDLWKKRMKNKFGTLKCFDLMFEFIDNEGEIDFQMSGRREKCTEVVISSVNLAEQIIDSQNEE